jgi:L-fuconolactonase
VLNLAGDYLGWAQAARSLLAALGADEREAIFGGNAARIYLAKRGKPCA